MATVPQYHCTINATGDHAIATLHGAQGVHVRLDDGQTAELSLHDVCLAGPAEDDAFRLAVRTVAQRAAQALALPEAPASVNIRLLIGGRECQVTLRDTDEARLLTRLHALLAQYPGTEPAPWERPTPDTEGWCALHGVPMRQQHNKRGSWWSHRLADGGYCKGR